jgi:hypothetical protein
MIVADNRSRLTMRKTIDSVSMLALLGATRIELEDRGTHWIWTFETGEKAGGTVVDPDFARELDRLDESLEDVL